jgi:kynureninase
MPFDITITSARQLDENDPLADFRKRFVIDDPDLIYLDGNSLGRLPQATAELMQGTIENGWGKRLIRSWNEGWIDLPNTLGAKIADLVGAKPDEIIVTGATSINLFKLAAAVLHARPGRKRIVTDVFNFPSDLYILQGLVNFLGKQHTLHLISSGDGVHIDDPAIDAAIDENTALVTLSHVAFKSAYMYDMARVTQRAHDAGALVLWDLSHAAGAVPVDLNGSNADLAVGCTYKYLNGGPGSPAFLYVRKDLQEKLIQPMWGWLGADKPFDFDLDYTPATDISRFKVGTPPVLSMTAVHTGVELLLEAGMEKLRDKSISQTEYMISLFDELLAPLDFSLGSPRDANQRGSHISLRHPQAYRITRALIESPAPAVRVIPDFRTPDNIRFGITPLYTSYMDIFRAMQRLREITEAKLYEKYTTDKPKVT